jgi:Ni,Fe-hydrogenase maturation factor
MKVYIFGNEDNTNDNLAFKIASKIKDKNLEFIKVKTNEDLPFIDEKQVVILDVVAGIDKVTEINNEDLDKLMVSKSTTVHDFDLGFQLKYLQKIGKLGKIKIIGIPMNTSCTFSPKNSGQAGKPQSFKKVQDKIDQRLIQSILRKLVAQDIHGS